MREHWANPSSLYGPGARSEEALNAARAALARPLGCKAKELYLTSCGSESNNLALLLSLIHILDTMRRAVEALDEAGFADMTLCPETMGKVGQLGTLDEVLARCV